MTAPPYPRPNPSRNVSTDEFAVAMDTVQLQIESLKKQVADLQNPIETPKKLLDRVRDIVVDVVMSIDDRHVRTDLIQKFGDAFERAGI